MESITDPDPYDGIYTGAGATFPNPPSGSEICDYEARNHTYRIGGPSGVLVQSYWSQQDGDFVVPDGTGQNFYVETGFTYNGLLTSTLVVNADERSGYAANSVIIGESSNGGESRSSSTARPSISTPETITGIDVYAGASGVTDTVSLVQTLSNAPVTIWAGDGATNIIFSPIAQDLDAIQGNVGIEYSSSSQSTVSVYDQSNPNNADWALLENDNGWNHPGQHHSVGCGADLPQ